MADKAKKDGGKSPDETWVDLLGGPSKRPTGVTTYVGLLRQSPDDESEYQLYVALDMRTCLNIRKTDVVHWEDLPKDKSPFGSLGGSIVYVRDGATVRAARTTTTTFETGAPDEFDLDIRLGPRTAFATGGGGQQTIPDTGCGQACETIPPFTDPDAGGCQVLTAQFTCNCTLDGTCICPPTRQGKTCGVNCQITRAFTCTCQTNQTCETNCGTCATCATCNTQCGTCNTQCGTCRVNTCNTKCGQETCGPCTHIFTQCNQHGCQIP